MRQVTVYGVGTSRALRVHWALIELGVAYHTEPVQSRSGQTQTPEYTALDPRQKIPVLKDGEFVLTESAAIVTYLGERYGGPGPLLVPDDLERRARYNEWMSFITMELDATSLYVLRRHEGLPHIYGEAPVACRAARDYFQKMIEAAAKRFDSERAFLLGDVFTGVDIVMMTMLPWATRLALPLPDVFEAYHRRIAARPAYIEAVIANTPETYGAA